MRLLHNDRELGFGPWEALCEAYFATPDKDATEPERYWKSLAQCQLELWGLTSRRLQAYMSLPRTLAGCKTPFDLVQAQAEFWQTAFLQGAEAMRRMAEGVGPTTGRANAKSIDLKAPARDIISLPVRGSSKTRDGRRPIKSSDQRRVA